MKALNFPTVIKMNLNSDKKVFIMAEAGVNHNGDLKIAKKLIDVAKQAGADAIKFQTFKAKSFISKNAKKSQYQKRFMPKGKSLYEILRRLELGPREHRDLITYAKKKGILFVSTPFDNDSVDLLSALNVSFFKISSGDNNNLPFLRYVASKNRPIILSTGRSYLREVREAVATIFKTGNRRIALLHCVSNYPADFKELNLRAITTLRKTFNLKVGFSDHTPGIEASIAAVALGAKIIEKHLTLNKDLTGPDHRGSLEPEEFKVLVTAIRNTEIALGDGKKRPAKSEFWGRRNVRKGLFAKVDIPKGTTLKDDMIIIKRPAVGIEANYFDKIIGRTTLCSIKKDIPIKWDMLRRKK